MSRKLNYHALPLVKGPGLLFQNHITNIIYYLNVLMILKLFIMTFKFKTLKKCSQRSKKQFIVCKCRLRIPLKSKTFILKTPTITSWWIKKNPPSQHVIKMKHHQTKFKTDRHVTTNKGIGLTHFSDFLVLLRFMPFPCSVHLIG